MTIYYVKIAINEFLHAEFKENVENSRPQNDNLIQMLLFLYFFTNEY